MASRLSTIVLLLMLYTDIVLTECSVGCISCTDTICLNCDSAYFLSSGYCSPCSDDCTSCNEYNNCTSCKPGKWGSQNQCQFNCADRCYNKECHYDTGLCVQCKPGLYGQTCQQSCSLCEGNLCNLRKCTHGCKQGYYEFIYDYDMSFCQECPNDCLNCSDAKTCRVCKDGFHLYKFNSNGKTFVHCVSCSLGSSCSDYCLIQNCDQCDIHEGSLVCTYCPEGSRFNGETCIQNTTSCSQECSSHCDDSGVCLGSCNAGWTGEKCSEKCSDRCLTCDRSNSDTCQQCKGDFCDTACSPSCVTEEGKQTCRLTDGYCLNGCEHNVWGLVCDQSCSSGCFNNGILVCDRNNGTCIHGCNDGYIGDKCVTSKKTTESEEDITTQKQVSIQCDCQGNANCKSNFVEGFFSGIGTSVVVVTFTVAFYQIRRRFVAKKLKSQQNSKKTIEMPTYHNEVVRHTYETEVEASGTNNSEQIGNTRTMDNVYNDLEATTVQ